MADLGQDRRQVADQLILRAKGIVEDFGFFGVDPLGRMDVVKRQIALAERTEDPARRLIEASAAVDGAVTAAGLAPFTDELADQAAEYFRLFAGAPWDRFLEAAVRGASDPSLLPKLGAEAWALLSLDNLKALAVILAVWAAATLVGGTPAWVINAGLLALGLVTIGADIVRAAKSAADYARTAYFAKTEAEIDLAASYFTQALVEAGGAMLTLAFSTAAFKGAKAALTRLPMRFRPPSRPAPGDPVPEAKRPAEHVRRPAEEPVRRPAEEPAGRPTEEAARPEGRPRAEETDPTRPRQETRPGEEARRRPQDERTRARDTEERSRVRELLEDAARGRGAQGAAENLGTILAVGGGGLLVALLVAGVVLTARRGRRRRTRTDG